MIRPWIFALIATLTYASATPGQDQSPEKDPLAAYRQQATERWEDEIKKLEQRDQQETDPSNAILFIGSSSIRMWKDMNSDLAPWKTINRGYGGAKFSDVAVYADRLVKSHQCDAIVVFVANDIVGRAGDKSPQEVARLFKHTVSEIRKSHAEQPIFLIAITPTPSRFKAWAEIKQANAELEKVCAADDSLHFIATESKYLDADGNPMPQYFLEDMLHQNRDGYAVWSSIVKESLAKVLKSPK
jgi:lysophospholipase L1-like esterase